MSENSQETQPVNERLSIGRMAKLNCVTEKTLRLYQDRGLLIPAYVDDDSGYRYYSLGQSIVLDKILRLQTMGFSLTEIKAIMDETDLGAIAMIFQSRIVDVDRKILDLQTAKRNLEDMLYSFGSFINNEGLYKPRLTWLPAIKLIEFDISEFDFVLNEEWAKEDPVKWNLITRRIKQRMRDHNMPLSLFDNVATMAKGASFQQDNWLIERAAIIVPDNVDLEVPGFKQLPAGFGVVLEAPGFYDEQGRSVSEKKLIREMMRFSQEHGLIVSGDYLGFQNIQLPAECKEERSLLTLRLYVDAPKKPIEFPPTGTGLV